MARVLQSPGKYVQGKNVLAEMADYLQDFGEKVLVIADPVVDELFSEELESGLKGKK